MKHMSFAWFEEMGDRDGFSLRARITTSVAKALNARGGFRHLSLANYYFG